jgi:DNA-binding response OmpR family regulator
MLTARGYAVLAARDGHEAAALAARHEGPIHLMLSDVVLPGGSGVEAVDAIRSHTMNLRVLFMSGYTDHAAFLSGELPEGMNFIQKPFSAASLTRRIREVLDA